MAMNDDLLDERRRQWNRFTRLLGAMVVGVGLLLLGMLLWLV
jgi:hypothetical protein